MGRAARLFLLFEHMDLSAFCSLDGNDAARKGLFWMAYSGLACLLEKLTEKG